MPSQTPIEDDVLVERSLRSARETRALLIDTGVLRRVPDVFASQFGQTAAIVVADANTFEAAGRDVHDSFRGAAHQLETPFVFSGRSIYAEWQYVEQLEKTLASCGAIPVAVGAGTINDLVKLVSHRLGRPYMVVATAASMDGYTAYGASITFRGSKQTFECPAPRAVVADLNVIAAAPDGLNASGYADLLAKVAAGADWLLADAAGAEALIPEVWNMVQAPLRRWVEDPSGVRERQPLALRRLLNGLLVSGFAMQAARSSRPASGAEHQFSHLWDMQRHEHLGAPPSHGFKVGIGTLASLSLYQELLALEDLPCAADGWPPLEVLESEVRRAFGDPNLVEVALQETRAKYVPPGQLRHQIERLRTGWRQLRARLAEQLLPLQQARNMLRQAGCPSSPGEIGISRQRLRASFRLAWFIRRRFTVLDLAVRTGLLELALDRMFGPGGAWDRAGGGAQ